MSLSKTVTGTERIVTVSYSSALSAATTAWAMVAVSSVVSASSAAHTVTLCAVSQLLGVKVRLAGETVTSLLPVFLFTAITTLEVGSTSSFTVYVAVPPSGTVSVDVDSVNPGASSSSTTTPSRELVKLFQ